jgi:hypothetical protein
MRTLSVILAAALIIIFLGGYFSFGGKTLFQRVDNSAGIVFFTSLYSGVFFFLNTRPGSFSEPSTLKEFQQKPLGIDNKQKYRVIDDAAKE